MINFDFLLTDQQLTTFGEIAVATESFSINLAEQKILMKTMRTRMNYVQEARP